MRRKAYGSDPAMFFATLRQLMATHAEKLSDPWTQNPFVRSIVGSYYRIVRGVPLIGVAGSKPGDEEAQPLGDADPLSLLLAHPNPMQTGGEFAGSVFGYALIEGVAYVICYGKSGLWTPKDGDVPREMLPADPRVVSIKERDPVSGLVKTYEVPTANGRTMPVPAESMVVLTDFNPRDLQCGSSPLASVWSAMEADRMMDQFAAALLENGANPGTLISLKATPSEREMASLRAQFDDKHKGARKAGRTAVVGPDVTLTAFPAQTAKDMQATESRDSYRDRIKAVLGATDYEVGRVADYNRANSEAARAYLWTNLILPTLEWIEAKFWARVFEPLARGKPTARWMKFDLSKVAALRPMLDMTATTAATLVGAGYDAEAVSEKLGLDLPVAEIDEPEPPPPVVVDQPPPVEPAKSGPHIWVKRDKPKPKPISRTAAKRINDQWRRHAERRLGVKWRKFTGARYAETVRLVRNLSDLGAVSPSLVDQVMGDAATWRREAEAAAKSGLSGAGSGLVDNLGLELGGFKRIDVGQEVYQAAALRRVGQMVEVGSQLRTRIRDSVTRAIADAGTDGVSVDELEKILAQRFKGRLPSNAATVARTEVGMFSSAVRRDLMVAEGIDEHEWSASMDEHTREDHRAVDGERRPLGQRFSNGLLYPLESGAPPEQVINCRCIALPYMREADE